MVKLIIYILALMLFAVFLVSCGSSNEQDGGFDMSINENNVFEHNKQRISDYITAENEAILDSTINRLINAGVGAILDVTIVADTGGWDILLTDDKDQVYYLELDRYGCVILLRKDSDEGEVLFAVTYG